MLSNVLAASERPMTGARFRRSTERRRSSCAPPPAVPKTETAACATRYEVQAVPKRINSVIHAAGESKGKEKKNETYGTRMYPCLCLLRRNRLFATWRFLPRTGDYFGTCPPRRWGAIRGCLGALLFHWSG